jgi:cobalamin biosynthesis protein CobW
VFEDQLLCADLVVMNKADLLDEAGRAKVRAEVTEHLPRAVKMVEAEHGRLDPRVILGIQAAVEDDLDARPSHHGDGEDHDHDDFDSVALPVAATASAEDLALRVARAAETEGVLRIKGFAEVTGKPMRLVVQGVGARIAHHYDRPWKSSEPRDGRLVVIGLKGFDQGAVAAALAG